MIGKANGPSSAASWSRENSKRTSCLASLELGSSYLHLFLEHPKLISPETTGSPNFQKKSSTLPWLIREKNPLRVICCIQWVYQRSYTTQIDTIDPYQNGP